jgi:hypothetical protein
LNWCQGAGGTSCAEWNAGSTTCEKHWGGRITSCQDGGLICCAAPFNHVQCDGSCR